MVFSPAKLLLLQLALLCNAADAFQPISTTQHGQRDLVVLGMAKKLKNKQFELAKKLAEAKKQAAGGGEAAASTDGKKDNLTNAEIKEKNDRLRFQQLLDSKSGGILNDYSADGYLNREQEEEEIQAAQARVDRLFEGDPAPVEQFECLIPAGETNPLGEHGAKRVVPWLKSSNSANYLVVICDPRQKSPALRQAVTSLSAELPPDIRSRLIIINADTPGENRKFLKKASISDIPMYSDENMEWMKAYTALGTERFTMTMYIIADERVQRLARDLDMYAATKVVRNAVKSMNASRA